jgi:S-adenosylmethionine-dependent methyltransferase
VTTADPFVGHAAWFDDHYGSARGRMRLALVMERLHDILPVPPARVLDAGGGTGAYAVPLAARGYEVVVADQSAEWLDRCQQNATEAGVQIATVQADVTSIAEVGLGVFDAVLCHAVLMYVDKPAVALSALRTTAKDGAILSVLEKNRDGVAWRPGFAGEYDEALRLLTEREAVGRMGISNRAYAAAEWLEMLQAGGWDPIEWVGVRLFSDDAPDDIDPQRFESLLALERSAGRRDPYRLVARLIHVAARARSAP